MQPNGADVRSIEALTDLESALQRFAVRGADALAALHASCERRLKRLHERAEDARREVRRSAAALDCADEDDYDDCRRLLEQARDERDAILSWQRRVDQEYQSFRRDAARFEAMLEGSVGRGRVVLQKKIALLQEYLAISLVPGAVPGASAGSTASAGPVATEGLREFPLPPGFVWVPLADIDLEREVADVRDATDYRKVEETTMRAGMIRLRTEILPQLGAGTGSDHFAAIDRANARSYEHGLQRVFDAFFGLDHIRVSRRMPANRFGITNGRHRIKLAQELGWDAIPARADEVHGTS